MTGFGAGRAEGPAGPVSASVTVEVRSVNHRYLQVKVRTPQELSDLDHELETLCKRHLERGAVQISVQLESAVSGAPRSIDWTLVEHYRGLVGELAERVNLPAELGLRDWLALPGVLDGRGPLFDRELLAELCLRATRAALEQLVAMREREGAALAKDLRRQGAGLVKLSGSIGRRVPQAVKAQHKALQQRLEVLLGERAQTLLPADLAREVALLADKSDVAEELARLESHLEQLDEFLASTKPVGRALDFLVQELGREVNTIGSKCADAKITAWVIDAKTHVERLREQVQNVE